MRRKLAIAIISFGGTGAFFSMTPAKAAEPEIVTTKLSAAHAGAAARGVPAIQFETNFFDFGKITAGEILSGVFKFKNVGNGILKLDPPQASCDCTVSKAKPDTLAPGESGEIVYTIKLERALNGQRRIMVHSNDPKTPRVELTIQLDYTPLYQFSPRSPQIVLPAGKKEVQRDFTVTRNDGKPLEIDRLTTSREWISAVLDSPLDAQTNSARIRVTVHRPSGPPAPFDATAQIWGRDAAEPLQTLRLTGEILGEVAAVPPRLYWVIPDFGKDKAAYPAEALMRKIELKSVLGNEVELKSAESSIKGMKVKIVPRTAGQTYDLILTFDELPKEFAKGKVTVATSLASLPELEVPISVAVPEGK